MTEREELTLLREIRTMLAAIEARLHDPDEVTQALSDILATYAEVGQVREVLSRHEEELRKLVEAAKVGKQERTEIAELLDRTHVLLTQLRELSRKHVTGLTDLERAIYGGETRGERASRERQRQKKTPADGKSG